MTRGLFASLSPPIREKLTFDGIRHAVLATNTHMGTRVFNFTSRKNYTERTSSYGIHLGLRYAREYDSCPMSPVSNRARFHLDTSAQCGSLRQVLEEGVMFNATDEGAGDGTAAVLVEEEGIPDADGGSRRIGVALAESLRSRADQVKIKSLELLKKQEVQKVLAPSYEVGTFSSRPGEISYEATRKSSSKANTCTDSRKVLVNG